MKKFCIPFIIFFGLLSLLGWSLFYSKPNELPSALIGKELPSFTLPNIFLSQPALRSSTLKGEIVLLNVWATWCPACLNEHEMLLKIKNVYHVPIFAIVYKDHANDVIQWLSSKGNPFVLVGDDRNGDTAIDLGVYGTPETFVIKQGKIIYRHIGILDQQTWDEQIYPLIKQQSS